MLCMRTRRARERRRSKVKQFNTTDIPKPERIDRLIDHLFAKMPEIEADRAVLLTESYMQTENEPIVKRRALAFAHILENIPIIISKIIANTNGFIIISHPSKAISPITNIPSKILIIISFTIISLQ